MTQDHRLVTIPDSAIGTARDNVRAILNEAIKHRPQDAVVVVSDGRCELAIALTEAYRRCLPDGTFIDFDSVLPEDVRAAFEPLTPGALVVLIQSTSFRLAAFRIRLELFKRSIKVIEHPHLARITGAEGLIYIDALAYDRSYYHGVGGALKARIDRAYLVALGRPPSAVERDLARTHLRGSHASQTDAFSGLFHALFGCIDFRYLK